MANSGKYDGFKTTINEETCANYIMQPVSFDLTSVPGLGAAAVETLKRARIENTVQLMGRFLMLKKSGMGPKEHADAMYADLKKMGINSHRANVVFAMSEKLYAMVPKLGDENEEEKAPPAAAEPELQPEDEYEQVDPELATQEQKLGDFYRRHLSDNPTELDAKLEKVPELIRK